MAHSKKNQPEVHLRLQIAHRKEVAGPVHKAFSCLRQILDIVMLSLLLDHQEFLSQFGSAHR